MSLITYSPGWDHFHFGTCDNIIIIIQHNTDYWKVYIWQRKNLSGNLEKSEDLSIENFFKYETWTNNTIVTENYGNRTDIFNIPTQGIYHEAITIIMITVIPVGILQAGQLVPTRGERDKNSQRDPSSANTRDQVCWLIWLAEPVTRRLLAANIYIYGEVVLP